MASNLAFATNLKNLWAHGSTMLVVYFEDSAKEILADFRFGADVRTLVRITATPHAARW